MVDPNDLAAAIHRHIDGPEARRLIVKYFAGSYTGALFDTAEELRSDDPNRFTARDMTAVAALSVALTGPVVKALIERGDRFAELLSGIDDVDLVDAEDETIEKLYVLQKELDDIKGLGHVRRSKLLAHKRPKLVPIRDQHVLQALMGSEQGWFTKPLRAALRSDPSILERLDSLVSQAPVRISPLRALDVVVWMQVHGDAQVTADQVGEVPR